MFLYLAVYLGMMTSAMEQLIYVSTASASVAGGDVFDITQRSSLRNPQRDITGFLVFANGFFFQYVEGPAAALDTLLDDLSRDPSSQGTRFPWLEDEAVADR
jgi:Sensors of blue-light using FAD